MVRLTTGTTSAVQTPDVRCAPTVAKTERSGLQRPDVPFSGQISPSSSGGPVAKSGGLALAISNALGLTTGRGAGQMGPLQAAYLGAALILSGCGAGAGLQPAPPNPAPITRTLAQGTPVKLAPTQATTAEKYAHYTDLIRATGGRVRGGQRHVLTIRGLSQTSQSASKTKVQATMQDTVVVLWADAAGPHVQEFGGSSYPGTANPGKGPDVNGDGTSDVGMVREGHFRAVANGPFQGKPSFHVRTNGGSGRIPGVRDTNQDGVFSAQEWQTSAAQGHGLTAVLYHTGFEEGRAVPLVNSRGCLNALPIDEFVAAVGGKGANFDVTIVNAFAHEPGSPIR